MRREQDETTGAMYFAIREETVAGTINVTDLIMVDVDAHGQPIGVEFAMDPDKATADELSALWTAYPALRKELPLGRPKRPQDTNELAFAVVAAATSEEAEENTTWSSTGFTLRLLPGSNQFSHSRLAGNSFEPTESEVLVS